MKALVVVSHPVPSSLTRQAFHRTVAGLERAGATVRVIDLDEDDFDPRLTLEEKLGQLDGPEAKPQVADHVELLRWADRIVLVYPTWFGGFPARLKGWFDRTWINEVAYALPDGRNRIHARLRNVKRLEVVTTHGSSRWLNLVQGNPGRLAVNRMFRLLCHPLCRTRFLAVYDLDRVEEAEVAAWLDSIEAYFAR